MKKAEYDSTTALEDGQHEDDPADDDMNTNIESKRDAAIRQLLAKEDLGII